MDIKITRKIILALALLALLLGCSPILEPKASDQSAFSWAIYVHQVLIRDKLHTDSGAQMYDGTVANTTYDNTPQSGNVFVLLELTVSKQKTGANSFSWRNLTLQNLNNADYQRLDNDSFLESHGYKRLPGTDLKLGEKKGWICFEIPKNITKGELIAVYESEDERNIINIEGK